MHAHPYATLAINMVASLAAMYLVMFSMIDGRADVRNNINMLNMALTMVAPMAILTLATVGGIYPNRTVNLLLIASFHRPIHRRIRGHANVGVDRRPAVHRLDDPSSFGRDPHVQESRARRSTIGGALRRDHARPARGIDQMNAIATRLGAN